MYDDGGRLVEKWFPNGVNTQYRYNPDNTLSQLINRHGSGTTISLHDYNYDQVGNRAAHFETVAGVQTPYTYAYDELNRLTTVTNTNTTESYAYDPLGNRRTKTSGGTTLAYVHDNANQLLEIHTGSTAGPLTAGFVYDLNGNLQKKCEGGTVTVSPTTCTGSTVSDLTHDALNRLTAATKGAITQIYKYDDSGRRIQKVNDSTITNYLYNGAQIVDQFDATWGVPTFNYVYGPGADAPTIRASSTATQYYHQNGIGNVVAVTNQTGTTDGTAAYDAYGNLTASTGTIPTYGFTGREPDETGLVYYRARYYDPTIGRFVQRDPIGFSGGINFYGYVGNNPVILTDPTGLWFGIDDALFIGGGAAIGVVGQFAADALNGRISNPRSLWSAGVGGATTAFTALYTVPTMGPAGLAVAGAAGGAANNLTGYVYDTLTTGNAQFDVTKFVFDTIVSAGTSMITAGSWPGINAGSNSYNAIFNQITTKAINGTISDITATTAGKMFVGAAVNNALLEGAVVSGAAGLVYDKVFGDSTVIDLVKDASSQAGGGTPQGAIGSSPSGQGNSEISGSALNGGSGNK